jgi:hypothetical protein
VATLEDLNRLLASGVDNYHVQSFDGSRLLLVGSFDLCYYHDVELTFSGVESIRLPVYFTAEGFRDAGPGGEDGTCRRFEVAAGGGPFEVVAESVAVELVKVYYYDRGEALKPGERIAEWVKRADAERESGIRDMADR